MAERKSNIWYDAGADFLEVNRPEPGVCTDYPVKKNVTHGVARHLFRLHAFTCTA